MNLYEQSLTISGDGRLRAFNYTPLAERIERLKEYIEHRTKYMAGLVEKQTKYNSKKRAVVIGDLTTSIKDDKMRVELLKVAQDMCDTKISTSDGLEKAYALQSWEGKATVLEAFCEETTYQTRLITIEVEETTRQIQDQVNRPQSNTKEQKPEPSSKCVYCIHKRECAFAVESGSPTFCMVSIFSKARKDCSPNHITSKGAYLELPIPYKEWKDQLKEFMVTPSACMAKYFGSEGNILDPNYQKVDKYSDPLTLQAYIGCKN